MATRTAIVEGERNVLVTAETNNTLIVTGDRNTVEMKLEGAGAALAFAFRWNRPKPRKRGDRPSAPACFELHVDRDAEVLVLAAADDPPRVVNVYGEAGIGKTHVLVEALNRRECEMRDGTVYLDGRGRDADDLLHAVFEALFETRIPLRDMQIEHHLKDRRALLALENVQLTPDDAQRLVLGAPAGRLLLTSRERVLFDGVALRIDGLATEHAVAIAEQELGRTLSGRERAAAESVAEGLRGHPLQLRQTFSRARDAGLGIDQLAPRAASAFDRAQALSAQERDVAHVLAVHGDAPLGVEHIEALAGHGTAAAAAALEALHEARAHSPRYSLTGDLGDELGRGPLYKEIDRALAYFTGWAQEEARAGRRERVLLETAALVELLERAQAAGRDEEVVSLGAAIEGALAWGNRWAAWKRVLELMLAAAQATGDSPAQAAALHQLGTRAYATGDARGATRLLEQALALRERIGDEAGARVTRQNLRVVSGGPPLLYRLSHLSITVVAAIVAVLVIGAGVAGAGVLGGEPEPDPGDPGGAAGQVSLVVAVAGPGSVAGAGGQIDCKPDCEASVDERKEIVLEADPGDRAEFKGWSDPSCPGLGRCKLVLEGKTTVTAMFAALQDPQLLTVAVRGAGSVVSKPAGIDCPRECSASFATGRKVQLYATGAKGSSFASWTGRRCNGSTQRRCDVTMNGPRSVSARFSRDPVAPGERATLTIDPTGDGSGTVTGAGGLRCPRDCDAPFKRGTAVQLEAVADPGSRLKGWGDACDGADETCEVMLARDMTVRPVFERVQPGIELFLRIANPGHGVVTSDPAGVDCREACSTEFARGTMVTLSARPDEGWRFAGWGLACEGTGECSVTLDEMKRVTAAFERASYTLRTDTEGAAGTILVGRRSCSAGCTFDPGTTVTLIASSRANEFDRWTGCDNPDGNVCSVTMNSDRRVSAVFRKPPPPPDPTFVP